MKGITIRLGDDIHALLKAEAAHQGIGLSAYMREAAIGRAVIARTRRGHHTQTEPLNKAIRDYMAAETKAANND